MSNSELAILFSLQLAVILVTTLIASPIFELVYGRYRTTNAPAEHITDRELTSSKVL